ncbi:TorD/DmsD family molecular chaperone [Nitrincola tapanii]|uniref:Molecular chaperone n=1 Tax=Nitrincola tapanii TaxID=1708751 RepID=A0A5A9W4R5_9GAMM|nr:molecular chaperone TorD family protein [Nitrincola tapanii]KAA0875068.1 molecular chaperone [Nitrincola tapanii]
MNLLMPMAATLSDDDALRADIYALLAALCRQAPATELLEFLAGLELEPEDNSEMATAWQMLKLSAQRCQPQLLEDEYVTLFIGLGQGELTPFASWYLTGSLMEAPLIELREDLELLGFAREEGVKEPEDHIAALLEVMSLLILQGASLERQAVFFQRHLHAWAGALFQDMAKAPSALFYHAVALLGQAFIQDETLALCARNATTQSVRLREH